MVAGHLQEKKGYYYCVLNYKDEFGKRKTKWVSTGLQVKGNKRRAEERLIEERSKFVEPTNINDENILYADFIEKFWLPIKKNGVEITTYSGYENLTLSIISPYFRENKIRLNEMCTLDIQKFYLQRQEYVSASTIHHYHAIIHNSLEYAVDMEMLQYNPSDRVKLPPKRQFIASFYTEKELERLLEASKNEDIGLLIKVVSFYGLRKSEALGLKWEAIDFENKTIEINHVVTRANVGGKKKLVRKDRTKNKSSHRTFPLVEAIEKDLLELRKEQEKQKVLCRNSYDRRYEEYVFVDSIGGLFDPNYVTRRFKAILRKNVLKEITFHQLRHSCASILLKNGVSMKEIQSWLGHSDFSTTANMYAHLEENHKIGVASILEKGLNMTGNVSNEKEIV